ncbi:hypothetical protein ACFYZB_34560 [Streptomyces sp. NPDC001852]|uniref:hypothetical protein n=1 Tax=Streptomyces sp. NPDC001852 TaxID=3364619 RepID=UPI0036CCBAD9
MTEEQIRHARYLLTRPENTVTSIGRLLGVSRNTIYKYVPELKGNRVAITKTTMAAALPHPGRPADRPARSAPFGAGGTFVNGTPTGVPRAGDSGHAPALLSRCPSNRSFAASVGRRPAASGPASTASLLTPNIVRTVPKRTWSFRTRWLRGAAARCRGRGRVRR